MNGTAPWGNDIAMGEEGRAPGSARPDGLELRLEARPKEVSAVRRALEHLGLPDRLLDDAKLLATELVTNSIRHAGLRPDEYIHVSIHWSGTRLRVNVRDRARGDASSTVVGAIRPAPGARSGWGLYLVDQIASRWGTNLGGAAGYWFDLDAQPDNETD